MFNLDLTIPENSYIFGFLQGDGSNNKQKFKNKGRIGATQEKNKMYLIQEDYEKDFYEVLLDTGEKVICWPNAGIYNAMDNSGREWKVENTRARRLTEEESDLFIHL